MFDINFYMQFDNVMEKLNNNSLNKNINLFEELEHIRSKKPIIYNIETTNRCNMQCKMCPRTTMMTRRLEDLSPYVFDMILEQLQPHSAEDWLKWCNYCESKYKIKIDSMPSENHFFLYVISKTLQLHGFGEPVLDKNLTYYVNRIKSKGLESYFSTNPININLNHTFELLDNGADYIKYCFDSVDTEKVRGNNEDFEHGYKKVIEVLEYKKKHNLPTTIVITMINLNKKNQEIEYHRLQNLFNEYDTYMYLKSENSQWYRKNYHKNKSIHASEICKHPWMSMTIKSNGEVAMCMDDYNNEIILGDTKIDSLETIWNSNKYMEFRKAHINNTCEKCGSRCDLKLINSLLK